MTTLTKSNPKYPLDCKAYKIVSKIGAGVSSTIYKAICIPMNLAVVAIKAIDLDQCWEDFGKSVLQETKTLSLLSHPNILSAYCFFIVDRVLWVVMPFMSCGSLRSIVSYSFPNGLTESEICVLLLETLKAISYLHDHNHVHLDIKTGNILVDSDGSVKLADFGVSATIYEQVPSSGTTSSSLKLTDMKGTTYWMAPEVVEFHTGYGFKSDIWAFGVTALELAHGRPPFSQSGISTSTSSNRKKGKDEFSEMFRHMVALCLEQDPSKRPSAEKLLKHPFFKNCKGVDVVVNSVLRGLPDVEQMFTESQTLIKMSRADQEDQGDVTVNNKKIIRWKFCEDDLELSPFFLSESKTSMFSLDNLKAAGNQTWGKIATELDVDDGFSSEDIPMTSTELDPEANFSGQITEYTRNVLLQTLAQMRKSLEHQRAKVSALIQLLGGEVAMDGEKSREEELVEMVENLKIQLEVEKRMKLQE